MSRTGVVAIGRNEGERLRRCLESVAGQADAVVYVDSASSDGSVALARALGVETVELDMSKPFSAARARNEGFRRLLEVCPGVEFVQFVDGDCEVAPGWLERARQELKARPDVAVVCGRRRERFRDASVYNRLCDLEWDTPIGEAEACGGDALFRVAPLQAVHGYNDTLIAGEEPELCLRLRGAGWKVLRIDAEMTLHDAAMTRFGQWWRRSVRAGHAFAEVSYLHRHGPLRLWVRETRSTVFWGWLLPAALLCALLTLGVTLLLNRSTLLTGLNALVALGSWTLSLLVVLAYPVLSLRIYRGRRRRGESPADARVYAVYCVLAKFAQARGAWRYHWNRLRGQAGTLIEYKGPPPVKGPS